MGYMYRISIQNLGQKVRSFQIYGGLQCPLGRPVGLPAWPAGPARASVLPVLACRAPVGRQLDASWTTVGRQLDAK